MVGVFLLKPGPPNEPGSTATRFRPNSGASLGAGRRAGRRERQRDRHVRGRHWRHQGSLTMAPTMMAPITPLSKPASQLSAVC
jgi:hypothetical protein